MTSSENRATRCRNRSKTRDTGNVLEFPSNGIPRKKIKHLAKASRGLNNSGTVIGSSDLERSRTVTAYESGATREQFEADARKKLTELRRLYPFTYAAWKNMRYDRVKLGAVVDPRWMRFPAFLVDLGPRRHHEITLDRLDHANPVYGPGKAAWRDKAAQANNRRSTILIPDPSSGEMAPLAEVTRAHGVKPDTGRKRVRSGHPAVDQALAALTPPPQIFPPDADPRERWPWPLTAEQRKNWNSLYTINRKAFPSGYEYRMEFARRYLRSMIRMCSDDVERLRATWANDEEPTPAEEVEAAPTFATLDKLTERLGTLETVWPEWVAEAVRCRRVAVPVGLPV